MTRRRFARKARGLVLGALLLLLPVAASAQELEPGAYWPLPRGLNIVTAVNNFNWGDVTFDPALPVEQASARINTTGVAVARAFALAGRSANASVMLPVTAGHVEGLYVGNFTEIGRFGISDPRLKLAVNLFGAPAMTPKEFASYRQRGIIGVSVTLAPPLGQYDSSKVINLGSHRWSVRPELGLSRTFNKWVLEMMFGMWLFTDNTNFLNGGTREQDPIVATQIHLTYKFRPNMWLAGDANFYTGGRSTVNGRQNVDLQKNSRIGATFSKGLTRRQAIRMSVSRGAYTTIGADFTSIAVGYNFAWTR